MFGRGEISHSILVTVFIEGAILFKFLLFSPIILDEGLFPEEGVVGFVLVE